MMMLQEGKFPRIYTFKEILETYLEHLSMVLRKSFKYDLKQAEERLEILDGYLKALENIDKVLIILKESKDKTEATNKLQEVFAFTSNQIKAILDMKLQRLVHLEVIKIQKEHDEIEKQVAYLNFILNDKNEFNNNIKKRN